MEDSKKVLEQFKHRAVTYDKDAGWVKDCGILDLMVKIAKIDINNILDVGAGTGAVSKYFLHHFPSANIIALDNCEDMLERINDDKINKCVASVDNIPFPDDSFDLVVSRQCLHYLNDVDKAVSEIRRVLKDGGQFVFAEIIPRDDKTKKYWEYIGRIRQPHRRNFYSFSDWKNIFANGGFKLDSNYNYTTRSSFEGWKYSKNFKNSETIKKLEMALLNSEKSYKESYQIILEENDIKFNSYWTISSFV